MPTPDRSIARLLQEARASAGLTQREMARRAGTAQSVVARVEGGATSPTWETLVRLFAAAGFEIEPVVRPRAVKRSHMLSDVKSILRLTAEERLTELRNVSRLVTSAR